MVEAISYKYSDVTVTNRGVDHELNKFILLGMDYFTKLIETENHIVTDFDPELFEIFISELYNKYDPEMYFEPENIRQLQFLKMMDKNSFELSSEYYFDNLMDELEKDFLKNVDELSAYIHIGGKIQKNKSLRRIIVLMLFFNKQINLGVDVTEKVAKIQLLCEEFSIPLSFFIEHKKEEVDECIEKMKNHPEHLDLLLSLLKFPPKTNHLFQDKSLLFKRAYPHIFK